MRVVIIGAGNVATVFGRLISAAGHTIIQVFSRSIETAQLLGNASMNELKNTSLQSPATLFERGAICSAWPLHVAAC